MEQFIPSKRFRCMVKLILPEVLSRNFLIPWGTVSRIQK
jgi:hypothetical protein